MSETKEENVLYGGPNPPLIDTESKSLGEIILKKLTENGDNVIVVSETTVF